jgi:hypothetical protein
MSTKFVMLDVVRRVEERFARQHVRGSGEHAVFAKNSEGWYAVFESCPASIYLGSSEPELAAGDRVRLTVERV